MANYSRWEEGKKNKSEPSAQTRAGVEQDLDLGQLIYDLRTEAGLGQRELADRMGTTQSFPTEVPDELTDAGSGRLRTAALPGLASFGLVIPTLIPTFAPE